MASKKLDTLVLSAAVIGSLIFVNILGTGFFGRADLTRNKEYTLSRATKDMLESLKDPVTIRAYFTKDLPPPLSSVARYVKDMLDEYYAYGEGNIRYEFIDPTSEETEEDKQKKKDIKRDIFGRLMREKTSVEQELERVGVVPFFVTVNEADKREEKRAYMGVVVSFGDKQEVMPVVQRTEDFEYELTTLIRKVSREKAPKLALITGHGNPDLQEQMGATYGVLQQLYDVTTLDLAQKKEIGDDVDAILVVGPRTPFTDDEKRALDRFVMSGRSAAFLLGPVAPDIRTLEANPLDHGLTDLIATYGVKLEPGLVLDTECSTITVSQQRGHMRITQPVRYPFVLQPPALNPDHHLTRGLAGALFPFMGPLSLDAESREGFKADVLVRSSENGWIQEPPYNLDPFQRWSLDAVGELAPRDLVVSLTGAIRSHYAGSPEGGEGQGPATAENARVLVANGHAFVLDQFMSKGNQALLLNLLDWLVLDEALLAVRSRGLDAAPIDELTDGTRSLVKYLNIVGLPLAFVGFGLVRWRMRESRRKKVTL